MVDDICRLCLAEESDMIWIFDERISRPENMKEVIAITTGVQISKNDKVTQKVCSKCCQITLKMYKFRTTAKRNDEELKKRLQTLANEFKTENKTHTSEYSTELSVLKKPVLTSNIETAKKINSRSSSSLHQSVLNICKKYPSLRIPATCLNQHLDPHVVMTKINVVANKQVAFKKTYSSEKMKALIIDNRKRKHKINSESSLALPLKNDEPKLKRLKIKGDKVIEVDVVENISDDNYDSSSLLLQSSKPSTQTHICNICNKVLYSVKELFKHSKQHLRCPFCKKRFHNLEKKNHHYENECHIKIMMNNLPTIPLQKIDQNLDVRLKYSDAFSILSSNNGASINLADSKKRFNDIRRITDSSEDDSNDVNDEKDPLEDDDALEIIIPDENDPLSPIPEVTEPSPEIAMTDVDPLSITTSNNMSNQLQEQDPLEILTSQPVKTKNIVGTTVVNELSSKKNSDISELVLKPVIKVNGVQLISNQKSSEIKLVKTFLKKCKSGIIKKCATTQTDTPTRNNITHLSENTCELKKFRQYLAFFKIPVRIKHGTFNVFIKYNDKFNDQLKCKDMDLWENETIISPKAPLPVITVLPDTPNHNIKNLENFKASQQLVALTNQTSNRSIIENENITKNQITSKPSVLPKVLISKKLEPLPSTNNNHYKISNVATISHQNLNINPDINNLNRVQSNNDTNQKTNLLVNSQITLSYESFKSLINVQADVPITKINIQPNPLISAVTVEPNIPVQNVNVQTISLASASCGTSILSKTLLQQNPAKSNQPLLLNHSTNSASSTISGNIFPMMNNVLVNSNSATGIRNKFLNSASRTITSTQNTITNSENDNTNKNKGIIDLSKNNGLNNVEPKPALSTTDLTTTQYVRVKSMSELK